VNADTSQAGAFDHATERLAELELRLAEPMPALSNVELGAIDTTEIESRVEFETQQSTFESWVARIKDYILDGDVMQVVVSQRMTLPFTSDPINLYRALRHLNPSPYLFYLDLDEFHIVGSSPEILVRSERGQITVRPIAGTIRRGSDEEEDAMLAAALLNDEKERAEHLMLIDLGRNDVGRVAAPGSVELTDKMVIEKYSHVMHIVSNVTGSSRNGVTAIDALRATLPAGTLSGAPKIRAMEIIDELEPVKRGVYGGAIGYLTWSGDMDTAIAIRTAVIKDGQLVVQAGAGVVADSVPASEWEETLNKARAVLRAAAMVEAC
jgi:anthranilate synthase component 1